MLSMRYPILFIPFAIFALYFTYKVNRTRSYDPQILEKMQKEEIESYYVRPKPVEDEQFIKPSVGKLHFFHKTNDITEENEQLITASKLVESNSEKKMLRFENVSNIDLKLRYGAKNLDMIVEYETNYENYINSLIHYAELLINTQIKDEASVVLEEAVNLGCDYSKCFMLLADIYYEQKNIGKLYALKKNAFLLNSILKGKIVSYISNRIDEL